VIGACVLKVDVKRLLLAAATAVTMVVSGCGSTDGPDAAAPAAVVGATPIVEARLTEWFPAFAPHEVRDVDPTGTRSSLEGCGKRASRGCASKASAARDATLGFLIRWIWYEKEAKRRGVRLTARELARAVRELRGRFSTRVARDKYLDAAGMTRRQMVMRVQRDALAVKLTREIAPPDLSVSKVDVSRFYRRNASAFDIPRTRDLRVVAAPSRSAALAARARLARGARWATVGQQFPTGIAREARGRASIDTQNTHRNLRARVFRAPLGRLRGPIDVNGSWWVFSVYRDHPARRMSLAEATPRIKVSIRSTREQFAADRLIAYLTRRYRSRTACHNGYTALECRNVPRSPVAPSGSGD
jgi:hypothetical protein